MMGSEGPYYGGGRLSFTYPVIDWGVPTTSTTPERPEPYPLRTAALLRISPPLWLTNGVWSVLAAATDAVIEFAARLDVTYDEHIEPVLSEWRRRRFEAECEQCGTPQPYSDRCVECDSPWVHHIEGARQSLTKEESA